MDKDKCAKGDACCKNKAGMGHLGHEGCEREKVTAAAPKSCCKDHK